MLTILCLILTNKFWFKFRPIPVDFDILGNGNYNVEVQLNKKNNDEFKKVKNGYITINSNQNFQHARIEIARAKYPKRIKLIFHNVENKTPIKISNLNIKDGKINLIPSQKESFKAIGASIKTKDALVILYPKDDKIELIYKNKLNINPSIKFEFEIFIIILVVSFLFFWKLINYISNFKTLKQASRLDIIFLTSFFIILFIPMSKITNERYDMVEYRKLAAKPVLFPQKEVFNFNYFLEFNKWFEDRFNFRKKLIKINNFTQKFNKVYRIKDSYYIKNNDWMFYNAIKSEIKKEDYNHYIKTINELNKFCKNNNIKLYILLVPSKNSLYKEKTLEVAKLESNDIEFEKLYNHLLNHTQIPIIYPKEQLIKNKKNNYMYFKTDHHLTDEGTYIVYQELMKAIKKDFKNIYISSKDDYTKSYSTKIRYEYLRLFLNGETYKRLQIDNENILKDNYPIYDYKKIKDIEITSYDKLQTRIFLNKEGKYNLTIIGRSLTENLSYIMLPSFKKITKYRVNNGEFDNKNMYKFERWKNKIQEESPDILVIYEYSEDIPYLLQLFASSRKG